MNRILCSVTRNEILQGYTVWRYSWIAHNDPYTGAKYPRHPLSNIYRSQFNCLKIKLNHFTTNRQRLQSFVTTEDTFDENINEKPTASDIPAAEDSTSSTSENPKTTKKKRRSRVKKSFVWSTWNRPEAHLDMEMENAILKGDMKCRSRPIRVIKPLNS